MEFLYILFSKLVDLIFHKKQKPIVRLYSENNRPILKEKENEFELKFYLNNKSNSAARSIRLTADFYNLEILTLSKKFKRLPRGFFDGDSAIQYDYPGVIYNYPNENNTCIGKILFKIKDKNQKTYLNYDIVAENMSYFRELYYITPRFEK